MLEDEWPALRGVTLKTGVVLAQESHASTLESLLKICAATFDRHPDVRIVAIHATYFAFQYRMMMRQLESCAHFQVALEARFRISPWINNRASPTAGLHVQTPGAVTRFTAHVLGIFAFCRQASVGGSAEILGDFAVTGIAGI